jgi:signal transduction histidine kinase
MELFAFKRPKWPELRFFKQHNVFHSARLKLTVFYFAILLVFCLVLTFGAHAFTDHELDRGNMAQRGIAHQVFQQYFDQGDETPPPSGSFGGERYFANNQAKQADLTRQHINHDLLLMDMGLLVLGALASYWFAGRTLRPIQEAHEEQKRFTSDASHELRTPLASMKLENEVFLRQKHFTEPEARELITSNLEEVDRLERLATNLLALNTYENIQVSHAPVSVEDLVDTAITHVQRHAAASGIRFTQQLTPALVDVHAESITELLAILLDNAVKYGPADGEVVVRGTLEDDAYKITVQDHGPGIADKDLPHLFERMYRGDRARSSRVPGHGIGLSLAQQIAMANEAVLSAANAPDGGAVFTLILR